MDQLLSHCLREIAFDGELGCSVSRFNGFISSYYTTRPEAVQLVDNDFCAYVWSLLVALSNVRVGLVPPGANAEVAIAPRPMSGTKKKKKDDDAMDLGDGSSGIAKLQPIVDVSTLSLQELVAKFGQPLRMAVDEDTIFKMLVGTHVRSSKLSPMVYTALQLVCRGRHLGMSVHALGQTTGYDQKTCHYLAKQLLALDLIVKLPKPGIGANFLVHKYFLEHSDEWRRIRAEENDPMLGAISLRAGDDDNEEDDEDDGTLVFRRMTEVELGSEALFRARAMAIMQAQPAGNPLRQRDLLRSLGAPGKDLRTFCEKRLDAMIGEGLLESIMSQEDRRASGMPPRSYRLPIATTTSHSKTASRIWSGSSNPLDPLPPDQLLAADATLQCQILEFVERAGTTGTTLRELTDAMIGFDRRTIELHLARLEKTVPPAPWSHLRIVTTVEHSGRERRFRYYLKGSYADFAAREGLNATTPLDSANASTCVSDTVVQPTFLAFTPGQFYTDTASLDKFYNDFRFGVQSGSWTASGTRPTNTTSKSKGKPKPGGINPVDAYGRPMIGRPRKEWSGGVSTKPTQSKQVLAKKTLQPVWPTEQPSVPATGTKRKRLNKTDAEDDPEVEYVVKKRERARKSQGRANEEDADEAQEEVKRPRRTTRGSKRHMDLDEAVEEPPPQKRAKVDRMEVAAKDNAVPQASTFAAAEALQALSSAGVAEIDHKAIEQVVEGMHLHTRFDTAGAGPPGPSASPTISRATKAIPKSKVVNVSKLRRENELLKLAELNGGIMSTFGKGFNEAYTRLIGDMVARGEPISGERGVPLDRRTVTNTLESLQNQGRIHVLKAVCATPAGVAQTTTVYHLRDMPEDKVNTALAALSSSIVTSALPPPPDASATIPPPAPPISQAVVGLSLHKDKNLLAELLQGNPQAIRDAFLTEQQTVSQLFGFLKGKAARAKELHCFTLSQLVADAENTSRHFVSRSDRIISFSYFFHDLPLATYCSLVPITKYEENLEQRLRDYDSMIAPVGSLPPQLAKSLEIGRAKAMTKIQELLKLLEALGLVIPLQSSKSSTPEFVCTEISESHPSAFDRVDPATERFKLPARYYKFCTTARVFHLALESRPFLFDRSVDTADLSMTFWRDLKDASLLSAAPGIQSWNPSAPNSTYPEDIISMLKKESSWIDTYVTSWYQQEYLKTHINLPTLSTPLDDQDPEKRFFRHICYTSCIPERVASDFFTKEIESLRRVRQRMTRHSDGTQSGNDPNSHSGDHSSNASMHKRRQVDWTDAVFNINRGPLNDALDKALQPLKQRWFKTAMTRKALHQEMVMNIARYTTELNGSAPPPGTSSLAPPAPPTFPAVVVPPLPPVQQMAMDQTPVAEVIEKIREKNEAVGKMIGKRAQPQSKKKKKPKGRREEDEEVDEIPALKGPTRRRRFGWTPQFDDLAMDAAAILRARAPNGRVDWTSVVQVFPGMDRNSVRARVTTLRNEAGGESYAQRLEQAFKTLHKVHAGSDELPDPTPRSTKDFPLRAHVEFLRKYVDKQALRVGLGATQGQEPANQLWNDVSIFSTRWEIVPKTPGSASHGSLEYLWSSISEDQRERENLKEAIILPPSPDLTSASAGTFSNDEVVQATLKMMLSTPEDRFSADVSSEMLKHFGEDAVKKAVDKLRAAGKISALERDPAKPRPGRTIKISDSDRIAFSSWFSMELAEDAVALDAMVDEADVGQWHEWSHTATDGETVAFLRQIANDEVEIDIGLGAHLAGKAALEWNSRKADDGHIEANLSWRSKRTSPRLQSQSPVASKDVQMSDLRPLDLSKTTLQHGVSAADDAASCAMDEEEVIVDCAACLDASMTSLLLDRPEMKDALVGALTLAQSAGVSGLTRGMIQEYASTMRAQSAWNCFELLATAPLPLLMWTGYDTARLVYRGYAEAWTATLGKAGTDEGSQAVTRLWPRRWLDIQGRLIEDGWYAAVRAVASMVHLRPGIPQADLRNKFEALLDRQELNEVLKHLAAAGILRRSDSSAGVPRSVFEVDRAQEWSLFWFIDPRKAWYGGLLDVGARR